MTAIEYIFMAVAAGFGLALLVRIVSFLLEYFE